MRYIYEINIPLKVVFVVIKFGKNHTINLVLDFKCLKACKNKFLTFKNIKLNLS